MRHYTKCRTGNKLTLIQINVIGLHSITRTIFQIVFQSKTQFILFKRNILTDLEMLKNKLISKVNHEREMKK